MIIKTGLDDGQVLQRLGQRGATVKIAGTLSEAAPIFATILGREGPLKGWKKRKVGQSRGSTFSITLRDIPVGGPYKLVLEAGKENTTVPHFFVGDVWLLAGQSNMEGVGDMTAPAKPHSLIRCFTMRREWRLATDPLHYLNESPDECHNGGTQISREQGEEKRSAAKKGVGVGIFFARDMMKRTGVPQGLIATAHGGTSMRQWDPDTGEMYESMRRSLQATGQPLAGVLWYQGESETTADDVPHYTERMKKLVAAVRREVRQPRLPWVIVQIARVIQSRSDPYWNAIQEAQRLLPDHIKHLETVAAIDLPLDDFIHIGADGIPLLAQRMSLAMNYLLGRETTSPPRLLQVAMTKSISEGIIEVTYDAVSGGLKSVGRPEGFSIVNAKGEQVLSIFKTTLQGNVARLHCGSIGPGFFVHYGLGASPVCTLRDGRDLSLPVFGPIPIFQPVAVLPYLKVWNSVGVLAAAEPLAQIACPDVTALKGVVKTYEDGNEGFINERARWLGKPGQHYFSSTLELPEPMKLRWLFGYDGPFRIWLDGKPFFQDMKGTNPCVRDSVSQTVALRAGQHRITIAMDTNNGAAWGFFLRFIREDVTTKQLRDRSYRVPTYGT